MSAARAARAELQRLASSVSRSERQAAAVLEDLRAFRSAANATELRAEVRGRADALGRSNRPMGTGHGVLFG